MRLLIALLSSLVAVYAVDNRLLYTIPAGDTIDAFRSQFEKTCSTWRPAKRAGLKFRGVLFEPGDYSGKHTDMEARIVCSWYNTSTPNAPSVTYTRAVAEHLGATKTSDVASH
ncbi:hypothetical protein B0H10DRAFT_2219470 [Mycena sp. CBHHK59/15]|nr:hypothetical protein B0H10DRAFT_2219470 [Mycena sp. CBHHK59/15]